MRTIRQRSYWVALMALLFLFAACKGESPTAPPATGTGNTGGTGTTPPTNVSLSLTTSNANPLVDSDSVITATVTQNGQPVPNGTAVEFVTNNGVFKDVNGTSTIRTTTNGVATVTLTATTATTAHVVATVNNVSRSVDVTFSIQPTTPPPANTAPTISSITPNVLLPSGGQTIHIVGTNFTAPLRVLFDVGRPLPVEGSIVGSTATTIDVLTPAVDLGAGQQLNATVKVITQAGTAAEQSSNTAPVTFQNAVLTPVVYTATPNSGPIDGGTRVTIVGEGFQSPVQVLFGTAEARVLDVKFSQLLVEAPAARDTSSNGGSAVTGPVNITVINMNANQSSTLTNGFSYKNKMQITTVRPASGPATGGTEVTIDGTGFNQPLQVTIGGLLATIINVSGSEIIVRTPAIPIPCQNLPAQIFVTNTDNGDNDVYGDAPNETGFTFLAVNPAIVSTSAPVHPGDNLTVVVNNPGVGPLGTASIRFTLNGGTLLPSPATINTGTGAQTFTVAVPTTGFTFPTINCTTGGNPGTQLGPLDVPLVFQNATTGCTDTVTVRILPPDPNPCVQAPAVATVTNPSTTSCPGLNFGDVPQASGSSTQNITITNTAPSGAQNLTITGGNVTSGGADFSILTPFPVTIPPGTSGDITVQFDPSATGTRTGNVRLTTNDPTHPEINVCVSGNGT
ncbi:MAG: IPT/TIG domain-containing protein [Acidobacteria bacterium]|nr:IPT/TIG domain-containing protein [Acidobacteriota bacterium]MBV9477795.1 IPT/TIG domain-containing protein [Acidobacteriota bacterium]